MKGLKGDFPRRHPHIKAWHFVLEFVVVLSIVSVMGIVSSPERCPELCSVSPLWYPILFAGPISREMMWLLGFAWWMLIAFVFAGLWTLISWTAAWWRERASS